MRGETSALILKTILEIREPFKLVDLVAKLKSVNKATISPLLSNALHKGLLIKDSVEHNKTGGPSFRYRVSEDWFNQPDPIEYARIMLRPSSQPRPERQTNGSGTHALIAFFSHRKRSANAKVIEVATHMSHTALTKALNALIRDRLVSLTGNNGYTKTSRWTAPRAVAALAKTTAYTPAFEAPPVPMAARHTSRTDDRIFSDIGRANSTLDEIQSWHEDSLVLAKIRQLLATGAATDTNLLAVKITKARQS